MFDNSLVAVKEYSEFWYIGSDQKNQKNSNPIWMVLYYDEILYTITSLYKSDWINELEPS